MGDSIASGDSNLSHSFRRAKFSARKRDEPQFSPDEIDSLPALVDFNAKHNPSHTFCVQCHTSGPPTCVSFSSFKLATDRCREWLLDQPCLTKREANDRSPVAIFLESDIRIFIYLVGFLRAGIPCLLLSERLSDVAAKHLIAAAAASAVVVSTRTRAALDLLDRDDNVDVDVDQSEIEFLLAPPLDYFLSSADKKSVAAGTTTYELSDDSSGDLVFHSSGTTGLPKPIYLGHRHLLGYAACHEFSPDVDESTTGKTLTTLPLYHGFGLLAPCLALSVGKPVVLTPSASIPNANLLCSILQQHGITSMMTVPSVLEECISVENDAFKPIRDLEFIAVGGGPMKPNVAKVLLERGAKLLNHFGATELGAIAPIFRLTAKYTYPWLVLRKDVPFDIHELGVDEEGRRLCKLIAHPFGWNKPLELQDSLQLGSSPDGTLQVKILGRKDDLIVLKTGEKVSPTLWESSLMTDPLIKSAIVFGESRFQLGVILELSIQAANLDNNQILDEIWPLVEATNSQADRHARIESRACFILTPRDITLPRTAKGSIQRREVYNILARQIDEAYEALDQEFSSSLIGSLNASNLDENLRKVVSLFLPSYIQDSDWNQDTNLFELGMDSLQATRLHRVLRSYIEAQPHQKNLANHTCNLTYAYPTLRLMSAFLTTGAGRELESRQSRMYDILQEFQIRTSEVDVLPRDGKVVVITGATGCLGANLVEILTSRGDILEVICLVREHQAQDEMTHFNHSLDEKGIALTDTQMAKVRLIRWHPGDDHLGMAPGEYNLIARTATHIFHGAWPMNFNLSLLSLKSQIRATASLIELGLECQKTRPNITPRLILASSIAVVGGYVKLFGGSMIPEIVPDDPLTTVPMGYAEAKWVCERLVEDARRLMPSKINCAVIRIGQVAGSTKTGFWNPGEHIPRMLQASQKVNALPKLAGDVSWLPADIAANAIAEILLDDRTGHLLYHVENPVRQSWKDILSIIQEDYSFKNVPLIEFDRWIELATAEGKPLEDLRWFFKEYFLPMATGEVKLETIHSTWSSPTLRASSVVNKSTLQLYLSVWKKLGAL
ncbi:L-aminoadipate-semialdehyde dehydrogenase [Nannizzia gypsea CBS 118893]|uniref:L-aminoadipate-semialdehyde dehydrogenase n=1 Tax=Arthroderma gypseum (strain ATCC MYA-4604 / CBS 118893) TaxID=535722 RepID=E4V120_ARTGP|nr:L-aminoadipate-semialdehyde dehydrogenase [Nannizzia gypsea CBS 118893]EFR03735.1 L-aminoadipate-semialdehyde dehydrogenase [Nannizzia gypsea CBS 118893]